MTTTRTPRGRLPKSRITPDVIATFKRIEAASYGCACPPTDWDGKYWESVEVCPACENFAAAHGELQTLLGLKPWEDIRDPDATCPYPAGCYAARRWQCDRDEHPEELALYRALQAEAAGQ